MGIKPLPIASKAAGLASPQGFHTLSRGFESPAVQGGCLAAATLTKTVWADGIHEELLNGKVVHASSVIALKAISARKEKIKSPN